MPAKVDVERPSFSAAASADWHGPGGATARRAGVDWHGLVWGMVFPAKRHRVSVTVPGLFLMALAMGIGMAAYNTASNILFITLSLLLACLLLSGLLSWVNLRGVRWRLEPTGPWRAGHEALVGVELHNGKRWLPTYGLWLDFEARRRPVGAAGAEQRPVRVREALKAHDEARTRGQVFLRERLEAGGGARLEWNVKPERRGEAVVELMAVGSLFPFGFLRKHLGTGLRRPVLVWPAQVEYVWRGAVAARAGLAGQRTPRAGTGEDLHALRRYTAGDSHRLVHWKASARLGTLMVRQFAAETIDGFRLRLDTPAALWARPEQFELLCSFAATLAEDLYAAGRLHGVACNGEPWREIRRLRDLEALLDDLARLQPVAGVPPPEPGPVLRSGKNLITFAPEGARGVSAYVDGIVTASA